jgi:hypothetical protein
MYNLMVSAQDNVWEAGAYIWDRTRVFEHTSDEIREKHRVLSPESIALLKTLPTIFAYEAGVEGTPRIGKLKEIQVRAREVRIEFDFDELAPVLTAERIEELEWHLGINKMELTRTHWAVKEIDLSAVLSRLSPNPSTEIIGAIQTFNDEDKTLEELIGAIQRDIRAGKHAASIDRLHTYCVKRFRHLLDEKKIPNERDEPLHSLTGKYIKALEKARPMPAITSKMIKSWIGIFEELNYIRNNQSLAHDNELIEKAEACFIFEAVAAILRFSRSVEKNGQ